MRKITGVFVEAVSSRFEVIAQNCLVVHFHWLRVVRILVSQFLLAMSEVAVDSIAVTRLNIDVTHETFPFGVLGYLCLEVACTTMLMTINKEQTFRARKSKNS